MLPLVWPTPQLSCVNTQCGQERILGQLSAVVAAHAASIMQASWPSGYSEHQHCRHLQAVLLLELGRDPLA